MLSFYIPERQPKKINSKMIVRRRFVRYVNVNSLIAIFIFAAALSQIFCLIIWRLYKTACTLNIIISSQ